MKKQINPTIKAHLIRSAFYLLLLVAVCAIPFALAQRNASKRSVAKPAAKPKPVRHREAAADCAAFDSSDFCTGGHRHFQDRTAPASSLHRDRGLSRRARSECRDSRRGLSIPRAHRVR